MIAAGLSTYSDSTEVIEDPSIGVVQFYWRRWSNQSYESQNSPIETQPCSPSNFTTKSDSEKETYFYPVREKDESNLRNHGHKLKCVSEPQKLAIWGNYDSTEA